MRKLTSALIVVAVACVGATALGAKEKSVAGDWTLTVEQHFGLKLVLAQKNTGGVTASGGWVSGLMLLPPGPGVSRPTP